MKDLNAKNIDFKVKDVFALAAGHFQAEISQNPENIAYPLKLVFFKGLFELGGNEFAEARKRWRSIRNLAAHNVRESVSAKLDSLIRDIEELIPGLKPASNLYLFSEAPIQLSIESAIVFLERHPFSGILESLSEFGRLFLETIREHSYWNNALSNLLKSPWYPSNNVCRIAANYLAPIKNERVLISGCGSSSFLSELNSISSGENSINNAVRVLISESSVVLRLFAIYNAILQNFRHVTSYEMPDKKSLLASNLFEDNDRARMTDVDAGFDKAFLSLLPDVNMHSSVNMENINSLIKQMSGVGKMVVWTPARIFNSPARASVLFRKELINEDVLEAVLPIYYGNQRNNSEWMLMFLNKQKRLQHKGKYLAINSHNSMGSSSEFAQTVVSEILGTTSTPGLASEVTISESLVKKPGLISLESSGLQKELEAEVVSGKGVQLSKIVEVKRGVPISKIHVGQENAKIPYVRVKNLSSSIKEQFLQANQNFDFVQKKERLINRPALLLAILGTSLKPTIFAPNRSEFKEICISTDIVALFPDSDDVSLEFLFYLFFDPRITKQVEAFRTGGSIQHLTLKAIEKLVVPNPVCIDRQEYIRGIRYALEEIDDLKRVQNVLNEEKEMAGLESEKKMAGMLKHNLLPDIGIAKDLVRELDGFIKARRLESDLLSCIDEGFLDNATEPEEWNLFCSGSKSVKEAIEFIGEILEKLKVTLTNVDKVVRLQISTEDLILTNLQNVFQRLKRNWAFRQPGLRLDVTCPAINVRLHMVTFETALDKLIENAVKHGFPGLEVQPCVEFKVEEDRKNRQVIISYSNNGRPMSISFEKFIELGKRGSKSNGTGYGGYFCNNAVKVHGGEFTGDSLKKNGVSMTIKLPIGEEE